MPAFDLICGDSREALRALPASSVHTVVTSPPYWGLRDYDRDAQIGQERLPVQFVRNLVDVFREVKRVLRKDGTIWVNLGDTFHNKRLQLLPFKVADALQEDGWTLRGDVIWNKPNATPESVKDRPGRSHEYLFLLSKQPRGYYYDREGVREPNTGQPPARKRSGGKWADRTECHGGFISWNPRGRNRRSVWTIPTSSFNPAKVGVNDVDHFAMMPAALARICIQASTSEYGVCLSCAAPYRRQLATREDLEDVWVPSCSCGPDAGVGPATVLDPFTGSGTSGEVSTLLGRSFIGVDLNADYLRLARARIERAVATKNQQ